MAVPYTFGTATSSIPLSQLDSNFNTVITLGNTAIQLGNTVTTLNNMTLANVTISSGNVTITNVAITTANVTTANITTAVIGTETVTTSTITTANVTTANITTDNITNGTVITSLTLSYGTANGVGYLNGSKVLTTGSALTFDGTNFATTGTATAAKLIPTGSSATGNGLYLPAANALGLSTNGTNAVYIDSSQKIGFGVSSIPTNFRSQFLGTAGSNTSAASSGTTQAASAVLRLQAGGGFTGTLDIGQGGGTGSWLQSTDTTDLSVTYPLLLNPVGGNIGIGINAITSFAGASNRTLEIYNSSGANTEIRLVNATTGSGSTSGGLLQQAGNDLYIWNGSNGFTAFGTNNVERMRISSSGIVTMSAYGVGTATFSASGVISSVSDETWKIKDGIPVDPDSMLKKLEPGYWYYNEEKKEIFGVDRQLGFYAQNVNAAIGPEAAPTPETVISKAEDGTDIVTTKPWGYYDRSVLAITVMSLQKALATIELLTARIEALEAQ